MKAATAHIKKRPPHLRPDLEQWPITQLSNRRAEFVDKIIDETAQVFIREKGDLLEELRIAVQMEQRRIKNERWSVDPPNEQAFWNSIKKTMRELDQLPKSNQKRKELSEQALRRIIKVYGEEIAGKFKPRVFRLTRKFCDSILSIVFLRFRKGFFGFWGNAKKDLPERIRVIGASEKIRKLFDLGTLVLLPTHSSNLDSLVLGHAFDSYVGLPSAHYGAGLNLFNSEMAGYFMNRLGTYRVDRRKKNRIYLEVLKSASRIAMQLGVNSLFFPGGTRSRSGEIEQNLKLGLLGTTVQAQRGLLQSGSERQIFIVPVVISYANVLEDDSLYSSFLRRQGKSGLIRKKIKPKGGFLKNLFFLKKSFSDEMTTYLSIAEPMDVFGNQVDDTGNSLDKNGMVISKREYFLNNDKVSENIQREMQYTRHLANLLNAKYREYNVVRLSNLCADAFLRAMKDKYKISSLESILKLLKNDWSISTRSFFQHFESVLTKFITFAEKGLCLIEPDVLSESSKEELLRQGIKQLRSYQLYRVLELRETDIKSDHIGLILFYANRLECYYDYERQL